jgi:hypothetical protein
VFGKRKPLQAKGLCLRRYRRRSLGGFSEQASMTVDMGKFSVLATFRQLIPSTRSLRASSRRKTRLAIERDRISQLQGFDGDGHGVYYPAVRLTRDVQKWPARTG